MKQSLTEKQNGYFFTKWSFIVGGRLRERVGSSHTILSCYILEAERLGEGGLVEMSQLKIMQIVSVSKGLVYTSLSYSTG